MEFDLDATRREVEMYKATDWTGDAKVSIAVSLAEGVPALLEYVDKLVRRATLAEARWTVIERELEEERRRTAALREEVRVLQESDDAQIVCLTVERDRLRDQLGEVCEERDLLRRGLHNVAQSALLGKRRIAFEESGGSDA